jgi:hypothetical protein
MGFDTLSGNAAPSKFIGSLRKKVESFSDNELGGFGSLVLIDGDVGVCRPRDADAPQEQRESLPSFAKGGGQQRYIPGKNAQPIEDSPMSGCWLSERLRV